MATGAPNRQPSDRDDPQRDDPQRDDPQKDSHSLLSDDDYVQAVQQEFASQPGHSDDARRKQNIWAGIQRRLGAADRNIGAMSPDRKTLIAGIVMAASAAFAGFFISSSLSTADGPAAIKGSADGPAAIKGTVAQQVIDVTLSAADTAVANIVITSPTPGWLTVFVRHGDSYTPWIQEAPLEAGDTPFNAADHQLAAGLNWPGADQDHSRHNVCAVAVSHRSALALLTADIAKLWPSFTSAHCLFSP